MNHGLKINPNGTLEITLPENIHIDKVIVNRQIFSQRMQVCKSCKYHGLEGHEEPCVSCEVGNSNYVPSVQPERTCVNCGRTANNGGWYADGGTRCPIEEHYALPKDGYCHLWEKRNVTDDDYPEGRADE